MCVCILPAWLASWASPADSKVPRGTGICPRSLWGQGTLFISGWLGDDPGGGYALLRVLLRVPSFPSQKDKPGLLSRGKRGGPGVASGPAGAAPARGGAGAFCSSRGTGANPAACAHPIGNLHPGPCLPPAPQGPRTRALSDLESGIRPGSPGWMPRDPAAAQAPGREGGGHQAVAMTGRMDKHGSG